MLATSNIRDYAMLSDGIMNYAFLDGCVPGLKADVGDIDGIRERKNQFFMIEGKNIAITSTDRMRIGQKIMFQALLNTGYFTILILFCALDENRHPKGGYYLLLMPDGSYYYGPNDGIATTRQIFAWWYEGVDSRTDVHKVSITHPGLMVGDVSRLC